MKSFLVLFILLIQSSTFCQRVIQQEEINAEANRRKLSKIKSYTKMDYSYSFGKINTVGEKIKYIEYNEDGFELLNKTYEDAKVKYYETSEYDKLNNLITFTEFDNFNKIVSKRINNFDGAIQQESVNFDMYGNYLFKEVYEYDSQNNWTGKFVYDHSGNLFYKWVFIYDGNHLIQEVFYDTLGNVHLKVVYEYSNDKKNKESYYDEKGLIFEETFYEYPSKKKIKIQTNYYYKDISPEPLKVNLIRITNDKNLVLEEYSEKENSLINWRVIYKYDKNGNIEEEIHHNSLDEPVSSVIYKYDYFSK